MDKNRILDIICNSDFFKEYGYKHYWTSGSQTEVAPITLWADEEESARRIEIQLCCGTLRGIKCSLDNLVREIGENLVKGHYICKYDGSCPNVAKIILN